MQRLLNKIAGDWNQRQLKKLRPLVDKINAFDAQRESLSDAQIQAKTVEFKERYAAGESLDDLLPEAFATVKQACKRLCGTTFTVKGHETTRNMIPYDVQLLGGSILHHRYIAEMRTGEGKTLVATLPAYLNALAGKGVHVVTVNDYLASRDAEWMGYLYGWLGLTVGVVTKQTGQGEPRKEAYARDITYVENSELGFDYLRDNLTVHRSDRTVTARPLYFAIVDEVDSILIDEARTPMIISQASAEPTEKYGYYSQLIQLLTPSHGKKKIAKGFLKELLNDDKETVEEQEGDYWIDEKTKAVSLSSTGIQKLEKLLKVDNLYRDLGYQEIHHIENALKAQAVYHKDKEYIIRDGEILLVDDHTGRVMPGRRYSEGLHQAIEAKEGVQIQRESKTLATITYQHFFKLYEKLCGMTGTAMTEAEEFEKIYTLPVIQVPTHRSTIRVDKNDMVYFNQKAKRNAVVEYIKFYHQVGLPILIGTSSIETSEFVSSLLKQMTLPHTVLNAKYHEQEANIIMNAGKLGSLVVATNMAGRGTDIKLEEGLLEKLAEKYALYAQRAIDASDPKTLSYVTYSEREFELLADAIIQVFGLTSDQFDRAAKDWLTVGELSYKVKYNTKKKAKEDVFAELLLRNPSTPTAPLEEKDVHLGLFILGTEKHDSRRIDNQLRGRSGRQGDPGVSQFFVAMDDEIMRKMGGDKIQSIAKMMLSEQELETIAFTQSQFTNSIARAQKQMEARHFGIRKHLFDYDSVIDKQRAKIYGKRDAICKTADSVDTAEFTVIDEIKETIGEIVTSLVMSYTAVQPRQIEELTEEFRQITAIEFTEEELLAYGSAGALKAALIEKIQGLFDGKTAAIEKQLALSICKRLYLSVLDKHRVEHIDEMHYLREKVGLYGYAQLDPLVIYKQEAFDKFQRLLFTIKKETLAQVLRFDFAAQASANAIPAGVAPDMSEANMMATLQAVTKGLKISGVTATTKDGKQIPVQMHGATSDGVEVIEIEDTPQNHTPVNPSKLRPNDKVNIQYPDGKIAYGVKRKKVKDEIDSGAAKLL